MPTSSFPLSSTRAALRVGSWWRRPCGVAHWSPHLLAEVEEVLGREALRRWVTPDEARRFLTELDSLVELVPDAPRPWAAVSRDPDDDYLVALARAAGADALVSGDHDLTSLVGLVPPVMTPAAFLAMLEEAEQGEHV